jgi:hypothetical protein
VVCPAGFSRPKVRQSISLVPLCGSLTSLTGQRQKNQPTRSPTLGATMGLLSYSSFLPGFSNSMKIASLRLYPCQKSALSTVQGLPLGGDGSRCHLLLIPRVSILHQGPAINSYTHTRNLTRRLHLSKLKSISVSSASRKFHSTRNLLYDRLQNLEEAANRDRDNARTQAVFLEV